MRQFILGFGRWVSQFLLMFAATAVVSFAASVLIGEDELLKLKAANQWLVRDLAQQFSASATRSLHLLGRVGSTLAGSVESGGFSTDVRREFDSDPTAKALYLFDPATAEPLSRFEKVGAALGSGQKAVLKELVDQAIQSSQTMRRLGDGLTGIALRLGELPRVLVLVFDGTALMKADGGPNGERWMVLADDRSVLYEGNRNRSDAAVPDAEIVTIAAEENPSGERTEWSKEWRRPNGDVFQIDAVQTGFSGVSALALVSVDQNSRYLPYLLQISAGVSLLFSAVLLFLRQLISMVRSKAQSKVESSQPSTAQIDSGPRGV